MANEFEDMNFATDPFDVTDISDFLFFEDFNRYLLLGQLMDCEFDFAEGALAQCFFWG